MQGVFTQVSTTLLKCWVLISNLGTLGVLHIYMVMVAVQRERSDDVVVDYADAIHGVGGQVHLAGTNLTCGVLVHHSTNLFCVFRPTFFFCQNTQKAKFIFTSKFKFILLQVSPLGEKKKSHSIFLEEY